MRGVACGVPSSRGSFRDRSCRRCVPKVRRWPSRQVCHRRRSMSSVGSVPCTQPGRQAAQIRHTRGVARPSPPSRHWRHDTTQRTPFEVTSRQGRSAPHREDPAGGTARPKGGPFTGSGHRRDGPTARRIERSVPDMAWRTPISEDKPRPTSPRARAAHQPTLHTPGPVTAHAVSPTLHMH